MLVWISSDDHFLNNSFQEKVHNVKHVLPQQYMLTFLSHFVAKKIIYCNIPLRSSNLKNQRKEGEYTGRRVVTEWLSRISKSGESG